jgi:hypothetical protein
MMCRPDQPGLFPGASRCTCFIGTRALPDPLRLSRITGEDLGEQARGLRGIADRATSLWGRCNEWPRHRINFGQAGGVDLPFGQEQCHPATHKWRKAR